MKHCAGQIKYLIAIKELSAADEYVRCVNISRHLGVSRPSVSKMLRCLANCGYVYEDFCNSVVLTPEGDLIMAGGVRDNNYNPYRTVIRFHLAPQAPQSASDSWLLWGILAMLLIAVFVGILFWRHRMAQRKSGQSLVEEAPMEALSAEEETEQQEPSEVDEASPSRTPNEELMERIRNIIEQKRLYLNSELKVANVAAELGINQRYVSNAIKTCHDCSFSQFVNDYRIEHAKQMLRDQPDIKITAVVVQSGFANETSFFRTFKSFTGMTPKEWIAEQN